MIKTVEISGANRLKEVNRIRNGSRGIIAVNGNILISHEVKNDLYLIPGGGAEQGETPEECCIREVLEETGYIVKPEKPYLIINEYYEDWKISNRYYICTLMGMGKTCLTQEETKRGLIAEWVNINTMVRIFGEYPKYELTDEEKCGEYLREYTALKEYILHV